MAAKKLKKKSCRVYSYIRFSTPEQALGDSENRQMQDAMAWSERNGYVFDESIRLADRGLSGFHGHHRTKGSLGRFLALVEELRIPEGSILLVENIDRLSREGPKTTLQQIIFKLWDHGITLQTLSPEEAYPPGSADDARFIALLIYIQRARDESEQKSRRLKRVREKERIAARQAGKRLNGNALAWLRRTKDGFEVIPEAGRTIRRLFDLKIQGWSSHAIERQLNEDAEWTPPKSRRNQKSSGWRLSYIKKILGNPSVYGEYQPYVRKNGLRVKEGEPIPNGYPPVVTRETFYKAQATLKRNKGTGGPATVFKNSLRFIVTCAYCGGSMRHDDKGPPPKGSQYLVCHNGERNAGCRYPKPYRIRYDECLNLVLGNCLNLKPDDVMVEQKEREQLCKKLRKQIAGMQAEFTQSEVKIDNLIAEIAITKSERVKARYRKHIEGLEIRREQLESGIRQAKEELKIAEQTSQTFKEWKNGLQEITESIQAVGEPGVETRMRLNLHLREIIESIKIYAEGYLSDEPKEMEPLPTSKEKKRKDGKRKRVRYKKRPREDWDTFAEETLEAMAECFDVYEDRETVAFIRYVGKLRLGKMGRFLRIKFRSGAERDLVPVGSLASGHELCEIKDDRRSRIGWRFVRPDLNRLFRDFKTEYRKKQREAKPQSKSNTKVKTKEKANATNG